MESLARQRLRQLRSKRPKLSQLDLLDFIPAINPKYDRPEHLEPVVGLFRRAEREEVRALVSVPPQFGKTETILMGCTWLLARHPDWPIIYTAYGAGLAVSKSRIARDYARDAGVELRDDSSAVAEWLTTSGGGFRARGVGGPVTGNPAKLLIVDDPHKDRADAESALMRQRAFDWFTSTASTRVHPGGSIICLHTRWHEDDLIGRLSKDSSWEVVNLPAIKADGTPLWHKRPVEFLERAKSASEYDWWSLYMGSPRPRGGGLFRGIHHYDELPKRYRVGKGVDLAYSAKTRADYSSGVVLLESDGYYYVADVQRAQCEVPEFVTRLKAADARYPTGSWHWFCSTTERGLAQLLTDGGVHVNGVLATADKFVRAQAVSAAWNEGKVLVPRDAPWLRAFVDEMALFTGVSDKHDDQVDSLASAFELFRSGPYIPPRARNGGYRFGSDRGF